jgi:hypothetical protein
MIHIKDELIDLMHKRNKPLKIANSLAFLNLISNSQVVFVSSKALIFV